MKGIKWAGRIGLSAILIIFLAIAPGILRPALQHNFYREWLEGEKEGWSGVLTVWHVVGFKTYKGSITGFLESCGARLEKAHGGVYIEVLGLTEEALFERYTRGERPDIWSFPVGAFDGSGFRQLGVELPAFAGNLTPLNGEGAVALPYLYSGYTLLSNTSLLQDWGLMQPGQDVYEQMMAGEYGELKKLLDEAMSSKATARYGALAAPAVMAARLGVSGKLSSDGDFKAGQVPFMVGDARAWGDLERKMAKGGFTFDYMPLPGFTDQVQYIAVDASATGKRAEYAESFIKLLLSDQMQGTVSALGALPAVELKEPPQYSEAALQRFYEGLRMPMAPSPAAYYAQREALKQAAQKVVESGQRAEFEASMRHILGNS